MGNPHHADAASLRLPNDALLHRDSVTNSPTLCFLHPQPNEDYPTKSYRMVGTALVFGFLANRGLITPAELAKQAAKTAKYFQVRL